MPRNSAPHFKVLCSVSNHWKTADIWHDPLLRAIYVELGRIAIERYGDRTADSFIVGMADLLHATGCKNAGAAMKRINRLCEVALQARDEKRDREVTADGSNGERPAIAVQSEGNHYRIEMPNLAKKQFPRREDGTTRGGSASASASATTLNPPVVPPPGDPPTRRKGRTCAPEELSVEQLQKLQAWAAEHEDPEIRRRQVHVPELAKACLDHFRGKGQQRADWLATCRNWIRNQKNFDKGANDGRPQKPQSIRDAVRNVIADDLARRGTTTH